MDFGNTSAEGHDGTGRDLNPEKLNKHSRGLRRDNKLPHLHRAAADAGGAAVLGRVEAPGAEHLPEARELRVAAVQRRVPGRCSAKGASGTYALVYSLASLVVSSVLDSKATLNKDRNSVTAHPK